MRISVDVEMSRSAAAYGNRGVMWAATAGEISAFGATQAEARQRIADAVQQAVQGGYQPVRIEADGHEAVLWREPRGWQYSLGLGHPTDGVAVPLDAVGVGLTRDGCEAAARRDLAQAIDGARIQKGEALIGESVLHEEADRQEHRRWAAWQQGYQDGRKAGLEDRQCRVLADLRQHGKEYTSATDLAYYCRMEGVAPFALPPSLQPVLAMRWNPAQGTVETDYGDGNIRTETVSESRDRLANASTDLQALAGSAGSHPFTWVFTKEGARAYPAEDVQALADRLRDARSPLEQAGQQGEMEAGA